MSRYTIEYSRDRGPQGASGSTDASAITSGTVAFERLPTGTSGSTVAVGNHTHNASVITAGELAKARQHAQTAYLDSPAAIEAVLNLKSQPLQDNYYVAGAGNTTNTGGGNVGGGFRAMRSAVNIVDCTAFGDRALEYFTNGVGATAIGKFSQQNNLTGGNSTTLGDSTLRYGTGQQSVAIGYVTAQHQTIANYGVWIGAGAGGGTSGQVGHGDYQVVIGYLAHPNGNGSTLNTVVGAQSKYLGSGSEDAALGHFTLFNSTGGRDSALGCYAGFTNVTGIENLWAGYSAGNDAVNQATNLTNSIGIGSYVYTTKNHQVVLGDSRIVETNLRGKVVINGNLGTPRAQLDIKASSDSDFILGLSNSLNGLRIAASAYYTQIEAVDPTLNAAYRPLLLKGSTVTVEGAATFSGLLNVGNVDNRLFHDSGNLYIESEGNIYLRDTSTSATLWSVVNDGRTFSKTNVWHADSDGNARILYNGSGGATNFRGVYDFVSDTRGHGLKSDGTIVWGGSQGTNNRGTLSWDGFDKAVITVPEKLDIIASGAARYLATSHEFNTISKLGDYTVATLPSASAYTGYECNTTDSSVTTFGSTVAGGGSSNVKVRSNGTNWTVAGI